LAFAVHGFTTSGIVLGFLALVAVLKNQPVMAFMWLGIALFVDGIDGTLARKARVLEYTPNVDGRTLDNVIDFFTYVAVPALMIYWFNMTPVEGWYFSPQTWSLISAATVMAVSCYTFANVGMKSDDYYFVGFPALWNIVVLYFFVLDTGPMTNFVTVVLLSILTFIPIKFVHPLRVTDWRNVTIPMTVLWAALSLSLVLSVKNREAWGNVERIELGVWVLASIYFASISLWRSFFKKPAEEEE
ncbi:MAG: CDP-alcohol phosphatidyltransferase family protein, partial [Hyphomicrobiaceae bacterium]